LGQQVIKNGQKYGAVEGDTVILQPIYDIVLQPEKKYKFYIFGANGKYGFHITYGCDEPTCDQKISYETSEMIYDTIFLNYKNIILKQGNKYRLKSIAFMAEYEEYYWRRPARYSIFHRPNDLSDWYDSIIVDNRIQRLEGFEDVLVLKKDGMYGVFTRHTKERKKLEHGRISPCLWDSIQPALDGYIFYVWKDGKMAYLNAISDKYTEFIFSKNELISRQNYYITQKHNYPITLYDALTFDSLYTIKTKNGDLICDTNFEYLFDINKSEKKIKIHVCRKKTYNKQLVDEMPYGSLKHKLYDMYGKGVYFTDGIYFVDMKKNESISFDTKNWIYIENDVRGLHFDPIIGYDLTQNDPNNIPMTIYASYDGKIVKTFNMPGYYIQCDDNEIIAIKIDNLKDPKTGEIRLDVNFSYNYAYFDNETRNLEKIILGYYVFDTKTKSYKISKRKKNNDDSELWSQ
jgi:hypothetical protein